MFLFSVGNGSPEGEECYIYHIFVICYNEDSVNVHFHPKRPVYMLPSGGRYTSNSAPDRLDDETILLGVSFHDAKFDADSTHLAPCACLAFGIPRVVSWHVNSSDRVKKP